MRLMRSGPGPLSQQSCEGWFIIFLVFLFVLLRNEIISAQCWQEKEIKCGFYWSYVRQTFIFSGSLPLHFLFPTSYEVVNFSISKTSRPESSMVNFFQFLQIFSFLVVQKRLAYAKWQCDLSVTCYVYIWLRDITYHDNMTWRLGQIIKIKLVFMYF